MKLNIWFAEKESIYLCNFKFVC